MGHWWYQQGDKRVGPVAREALKGAMLAGTINPETFVWTEGMEEWLPVQKVDGLRDITQSVPPPFVQAKSADWQTYPMSGAWRRFCARIFDIWWESVALLFVVSWTLGRMSSEYLRWLEQPGGSQMLALLFLPLTLLLDAAIYKVLGNTPGKALLGLKVGTIRGEPLSFLAYARRNLHLWMSGLAFGIPLVNLITMANQSGRVKRNQPASYDVASGHRVRARPIGVGSRILFGVLFVAVLFIIGYLNKVGEEQEQRSKAAQAESSFVWLNPVNQVPVDISSRWAHSTQSNAEGEEIHSFTEPLNRAAVALGKEDMPNDVGLRLYVYAYTKSNATEMVFDGEGVSGNVRGLPSWVLTGHMASDTSNRLEVEIIKDGSRYWRIVSIQSPPHDYTKSSVDELRRALRSSIAPGGITSM